MFCASLLSTVLLALTISANPIVVREPRVSLSISRRFNLTGCKNIYEHDLHRAQSLQSLGHLAQGSKRDYDPTPQDTAITYVANVGIGTPPTQYSLIIDSGSSNTWIGASKAYVPTSSSTKTSDTVAITYGSGSMSGDEYTDAFAVGDFTIQQSIGVASRSTGFDSKIDGILGIGPTSLTRGTLTPDSSTEIPTVTDNLFTTGHIASDLVAVSLQPDTEAGGVKGELSWGTVDTSKYTGSITYVPLTTTSPASEYWGIDQSITYGETQILDTTAGIVDTGTTLLLIATNAFQAYQKVTGGVLNPTTSLLKITADQFSALQSLFFHIGGTTFEFTANAQIWPRQFNAAIGGDAASIYLIVADIGTNSGAGLDFVNGYVFLQRFYSVYDTTNNRVGIATTPNTADNTN